MTYKAKCAIQPFYCSTRGARWLLLLLLCPAILFLDACDSPVEEPPISAPNNVELFGRDWEYSADFRFYPDKPDFDSTNAFMLAQMANLAYSKEAVIKEQVKNKWKLTNYEWISKRCFVVGTPKYIVVALRGTKPTDATDWLVDAKFLKTRHALGGKVHSGFNGSFEKVKDRLGEVLKRFGADDKPVWFTGHSLGGAMAVLAAAEFREHVGGVYTYGQPRVGNKKFAKAFLKNIPIRPVHRVVYQEWTQLEDRVAHVPIRAQGFVHIPRSYLLLARKKDEPVRKEKAEKENEQEKRAVQELKEDEFTTKLIIGHRMVHYLKKLKKASEQE